MSPGNESPGNESLLRAKVLSFGSIAFSFLQDVVYIMPPTINSTKHREVFMENCFIR